MVKSGIVFFLSFPYSLVEYFSNMNHVTRKRLRAVLYAVLRLTTNLTYLLPYNGKKTPILVYHRICPLFYKKELPYANVYPEEFDKQMSYLKNHFEVVTVSEYLQRVKDSLLKGSEICITFDDGFRDNYIYAFPILRKYGLKATFFLTTKYIGTDTLFPWMAIDNGAKDDILTNRERWLPLSWEEVKEMMEYGMEFGTHTHTHGDSLSMMDIEDAKSEIEKSTRILMEKTGVYPDVFSYPHGSFKDYGAVHVELLKSLSYKVALTTNAGRNCPLQDPYQLKRIIIYEEDSMWEFKKKVKGAYDIAGSLQKMWLNIAGTGKYKD